MFYSLALACQTPLFLRGMTVTPVCTFPLLTGPHNTPSPLLGCSFCHSEPDTLLCHSVWPHRIRRALWADDLSVTLLPCSLFDKPIEITQPGIISHSLFWLEEMWYLQAQCLILGLLLQDFPHVGKKTLSLLSQGKLKPLSATLCALVTGNVSFHLQKKIILNVFVCQIVCGRPSHYGMVCFCLVRSVSGRGGVCGMSLLWVCAERAVTECHACLWTTTSLKRLD